MKMMLRTCMPLSKHFALQRGISSMTRTPYSECACSLSWSHSMALSAWCDWYNSFWAISETDWWYVHKAESMAAEESQNSETIEELVDRMDRERTDVRAYSVVDFDEKEMRK